MSESFEDDFLNDFTHSAEEGEDADEVVQGPEVEEDASSDSDGEQMPDIAELISSNSTEPKKQVKHDGAFIDLLEYIRRAPESTTTQELEEKLNQCNLYLAKIGTEILVWHRLGSQAYAPIFPELEKLVVDPVDFARVVLEFGESDYAAGDLSKILNNATVMVVKVSKSAHANSIAMLQDRTGLRFALHCATQVVELDQHRQDLLKFVETKLQLFCPNVYELTGGRTAALLITLAGGLRKLSQIPSNDIQVLGKRKQGDTAQAHGDNFVFLRHAGVLSQCPLVLSAPANLRRKAVRTLAGRVALAARVDETTGKSSSNDAKSGRAWRLEIEEKIKQWQDPGQGKVKKALPVPDMQRPKRRGGRRARKLKEKMGATNMLKLANRDQFGEGTNSSVEYSVSAMGEDLGMLNKQYNGRIRQVQAKDTQKLGERANKKLKQINTGGSFASGFSSLAFTPVQGMELAATPIARPSAAAATRPKPAVPLFKN